MSAKLPILRLPRERRYDTRTRVSQACESCRDRKSKCDGIRPVCSQCHTQGLDDCFYSERKAIRQRMEMESMRKKIEIYGKLLEDISQDLTGPIADRVNEALEKPKRGMKMEAIKESLNPSCSSSASQNDVELLSEDFNRSEKSRATGYIGNNSEVAWMQQLDFQATRQSKETVTQSLTSHARLPIDTSIASMNYRLDHQSVSNVGAINSHALPSKPLADMLFQVYLEKVHAFLPIIRSDLFVAQYKSCYLKEKKPSEKWMAVFNMILAISCVFCRLSRLELPEEADENVFSARARSLSLSENVLYDHSDLQQVQAETLMAFFFLIQSQINRSWKLIGVASRSAIALGLNIEKKISGIDVRSGEARKQLWWSIFRLENILSIMTGRVSCLGNASCSASPLLLGSDLGCSVGDLAQPINELQWTIDLSEEKMISQDMILKTLIPTESLYLFFMVDLSLIAHGIINEVYSTRACWGLVESRRDFYNRKLDYWTSTLHPSFRFQGDKINTLSSGSRFQVSLALYYHSIQILLNRPSLSNPAFEKNNFPEVSGTEFAHKNGSDCLRASLAIIALLPGQPDLAWCYKTLQWWHLLHVLTQATVILLLAFSIGLSPTHPSESGDLVWAAVKKGLSWLHCLGRTSEAAQRAFQFFNSCIHRISPGLELEGIPSKTELLQASFNSKFPWLRDVLESNAASLLQEIETTTRPAYSKQTLSPSGREDTPVFHGL